MNKRAKTGIGLTSIMLILIAFGITIFAVQGYMAARNNLAVTEERVEYTKKYYAADKVANEIRCMADNTYLECNDAKKTEDEFIMDLKNNNEISDAYKEDNKVFVTYKVSINDDANLCVILNYEDSQKCSEVKCWKVVNKEMNIDDKPLKLWDGK